MASDSDSWLTRDQYTHVHRQLLGAEKGDRFRVRFFCPMAKSGKWDKDAYVVREGEIVQLGVQMIKFDDDGTASYGSRASLQFRTDDGSLYKVTLPVSSTPIVYRHQRKSRGRGWVRQSRTVTDAEVTD